MWMWILATLALAGRYEGVGADGRVALALEADGTGSVGDAPVRWLREGDALVLTGAATTWRLAVTETGGELRLDGPPFGTVWLRPAPPPPELVGRWRHVASGGSVTLSLGADGRFALTQSPGPAPTAGRWASAAGALTLTPDGGPALRYRARREGDALVVSGGDLPVPVRFSAVVGDPAPEL